MKLIACIFCLFISVNALATIRDTVKKAPLYIVDRQQDASGQNIKPSDILNISILDSAGAAPLYGKNLAGGVVLITTKQFAMKLYQQKFGALNKKYKEYMDAKHTDSNLAYVLNNTILTNDRKSTISNLYDLKPDDIKSITFKKDSHFTTDATVIIITKDQ
jgi:outer membrane receptor protein involved in Fe transport